MKTQQFLAAAALLSVANCRPQILISPGRSSSKQSIITGGFTLGDPFTLPPGITLPSGVTLPPGFTIGTDLTRTGTLPGFTFGTPPGPTVIPPPPSSTKKPTSSSVKTTSSSTRKSTSSSKPAVPPTTSSTSSRSPPLPTTKTTSSSTKTSRSTPPPPPTTSSTSSRSPPQSPTSKSTSSSSKKTSSSTPPPPPTTKTTSSTSKTTPPITQPPTTKTTSSTKTTPPPITTTSKPAPGTNPYSAQCPIPSTYTVNNFISYDGPGGDVALTITYGAGVFTCPNKFEHSTQSNGRFTLDCDDDGLVRVITDGFSYIQVQEKFFCDAVPKPAGSYATLQSSANFTLPADALFCEIDDIGIRTCLQLDPDIVIPVQTYGAGGTISFNPLDIDGNPLPQCPSLSMTQPVVTNTATCSQAVEPTGTSKGTSTVRFTQTATVTIIS